jgi:serine/threonine protein kinase/Tol biopolymer transport system component
MSLQVGQQLGSYEITSLLGKGGMGEVYKAYDTRLDRTVAIKVLPGHVARDPQSRERFQREARAVAALNHPHICTLHDVGSQEGIDFLVMEYLEGETLAARLVKGPLPVKQVLRYAVQIASALDKAHRASIVHRDLKPGNIMLTKSGAKLLDFGLAKASVAVVADMPTKLTASDLTTPGAILGTLQYMAPEQIEGKKTDACTDIFAFGAVLYEMLTGKKAFEGKSQAGVMAAILEHDPKALTTCLPLAPPALDRVIKRCVSKDPDGRWQSAGDLTSELEWIAQSGVEASTESSVSRGKDSGSRVRVAWVAAALAIVIAATVAVPAVMYVRRTAAADTLVVQHVARMTHENGFSEWPTWSPDGRLFAFSSNRNGNFELYVGRVEGGQEVVNVTNNAADDVQPAFSPDGVAIAFVSTRSSRTGLVKIGTNIGIDTRTSGGDVWVTPALGGQARRLAENANFPVWRPGSRTVLYVTGQEDHRTIESVSIDGGPPNPILAASTSTWEIVRLAYSPDARWITFETPDRHLFVMPAAGGAPTDLLRGGSHVWDPAGRRIYYINNDEGLGGTRIEAAEVQHSGAIPTIAGVSVVGVSTGALHELAIAPDGKHLLASGVEESLNLTRVPLAIGGGDVAGPEEELSSGQGVRDRYPAVSPDGRRIALSSNRIVDGLWMVDLSSARWQRVQLPTNTGEWTTEACWAKDGQHLAAKRFFLNGTSALWNTAIDGSSTEELVPPTLSRSASFPCSFSPDGRRLVHSHLAGNFSQLFVLDVASRQEQQLTRSESDKYEAAWSPDGRWVAFSANTGGTVQVWRIPAGGGEERQITTGYERMLHLFYSPDGRWLYVQPSHHNIYRMPSDGGPLQPVTHFPESGLFIEEPTISPTDRTARDHSRSQGQLCTETLDRDAQFKIPNLRPSWRRSRSATMKPFSGCSNGSGSRPSRQRIAVSAASDRSI